MTHTPYFFRRNREGRIVQPEPAATARPVHQVATTHGLWRCEGLWLGSQLKGVGLARLSTPSDGK